MSAQPPSAAIRVYLSYRTKGARDEPARDALRPLCAARGMELIYDIDAIPIGSSFVKFMDHLSGGRCIVVFLSQKYFRSAYTLYELIALYERGNLDQRLIHLLRLEDDVQCKNHTTVKDYWHADTAEASADRAELARLLQIANDKATVWERIDAVWKQHVFPYLETISLTCDAQGQVQQPVLKKLVDDIDTQVQAVIDDEHNKFIAEVRKQLEHILSISRDLCESLATGLQCQQQSAKVVDKLLATPVTAALSTLHQAAEIQGKLLGQNTKDWRDYFHHAEQLCGWLLMTSVDKVWWFNTQIRWQQNTRTDPGDTVHLQRAAYVEVIISRAYLKYDGTIKAGIEPRFVLNDRHQAQAAGAHHNHNLPIFDILTPGAGLKQILTTIYNDLSENPPSRIPREDEQLFDDVIDVLEVARGIRQGKPVYYLVTADYLQILSTELNKLALEEQKKQLWCGLIRFVCCDLDPGQPNAARERQSLLLSHVAKILLLDPNHKSQAQAHA